MPMRRALRLAAFVFTTRLRYQSAGASGMDEETIKQAAYRIWEEQGKPQGMDFEHWLQAKKDYEDDQSDGLPGSVSSSVTPPGVNHSPQESEAPPPSAAKTRRKTKKA
jgi:hypothetical protein